MIIIIIIIIIYIYIYIYIYVVETNESSSHCHYCIKQRQGRKFLLTSHIHWHTRCDASSARFLSALVSWHFLVEVCYRWGDRHQPPTPSPHVAALTVSSPPLLDSV
jgi:hypothetical protein